MGGATNGTHVTNATARVRMLSPYRWPHPIGYWLLAIGYRLFAKALFAKRHSRSGLRFGVSYPISTNLPRVQKMNGIVGNTRTIPIRPLKVRENTATGSIVAIGLAISLIPLSLVVLLFVLLFPGLQTDAQIEKNAVKATQASAHGNVVSTIVLSTADLPIDYTAQNGKKFKSQRWAFVFGEFHHEKPLQVNFLKGQPELATTNWALEALPLRWTTFWTFAIIFTVGVLLVWALTAVAIHNAKSLRQTAASPAAIEAAILSRNQIKNNRYWNYSWQLPNGKTRKNLVAWSPDRKPYFTTPAEDRALAIVCGNGLAHLVDAEGRPFDLGVSELEVIAKELRSA